LDLVDLPRDARPLAETLGLRSLLALVDAFGGTYVRVHTSPRPQSELARVLGAEGYGRLQASYGGEEILIPTLAAQKRRARNEQIHRDYAAGATAAELARKYHLHIRTVRSIAAQGKGAHAPRSTTPPSDDRSRFDVRHHQA
jgi:Mor family transcriptional regulator